jgi:hypothetical protein
VPVVPKNPLLPGHPAEIYLVLLGTPYFGPLAAEAGRDEEERAVEQVRRLGKVLLGPAQIEDPRETCRLWRSVAGEVLDRQGRMTVRAASFREGLPWDGDGVVSTLRTDSCNLVWCQVRLMKGPGEIDPERGIFQFRR